MKTLIAYYSYGGNTRRIAEMIKKEIGGDIIEIETVKPYTGSYNEVVEQGKQEIDSGFMPQIKDININLNDYDTVVLGSPVWWYTFAPAMYTFLHNNDLRDKTVYTFATNGGWIGHTFEDFEQLCAGATVKDSINIRFDENTLQTSEADIKNWIKMIQ